MIPALMVKIFGPNWKTSVNGALSFFTTLCGFVTIYIVITPSAPKWIAYIVSGAAFISAFSRYYVGTKQVDAGKVLVHGEDGPVSVPAHETPDIKGAKPVIPQKEP